jgi:cytochrome c-type biogenesis protein CcmH
MRVSALAFALIAVLLAAPAGRAATPAVDEEAVTRIASQLRCVVCQNLSVADSPSEMAKQMRELIRERVAQGDSPEQVVAYFVERYGEWVLLSPRPRGFTLLVWVAPFAALLGGLLVVLRIAARWARRPAPAAGPAGQGTLTAEDRARVRAELDRLAE